MKKHVPKYESTKLVEAKAKQILDILDSDILKNQNLDTLNDQYPNGETSLKDAIENLKFVCNKVVDNLEVVDKMGIFRSNFVTHFDQIINWLPNFNLQPSYINLFIGYTDNLMQWIGQWGLLLFNLPNQKEINQINSKIGKVNNFEAKTVELESLKTELQIYKNAADKLEQAKNIKDFFDNRTNIETIDNLADKIVSSQGKAEEVLLEAEKVLGKASDTLVKEFSELANKHAKNANLWLIGVFASIFLFLINLIVAHFIFNGFHGLNTNIQLNKLGYRIWLLFLIPPFWLLLKNNIFKSEEDKLFDWKNIKNTVLNIILPTTFFGIIFSLITDKIPLNIPSYEGLKIDGNSYYGLMVYFLTRITVMLPSGLMLILTSKYFGQNNLLKEEYEYKSVAMSTFASAIQKALNVDGNFNPESILNILLEKIYSYPRKNIFKYPHDPSSILDPINIKNLSDNVDSLRKILK